MSHIHLPDGIITLPWIIASFALTVLFLYISIKNVKKEDARKKVPFVGILAALMLLTMSIPLGFIPFHLNLAVLIGILAGPSLGFIVVFVVNVILAFMGHGGITVVGLNTLMVGSEVLVGSFIFRLLASRGKAVLGAGAATVIALLVSTSLMVSAVIVTNAGLAAALPHEDEQQVQIADKADGGAVADHKAESLNERLAEISFLSVSGWGAVAAILFGGIIIETLVTAMVVSFLIKVRPDILPEKKATA